MSKLIIMAFTLGMVVDVCMAYDIMLILVSMTLTLMQGHSRSSEETKISVEYLSRQLSE